MGLFLVFFFRLLATWLEPEQQPDWVNPITREQAYSETDYFTGFVSFSFQKEQDIETQISKVKGASRMALSESIFVTFNSQSVSEMSNINGVGDDRYSKTTVTSTSLEATGLKTETYIDHRKGVVYGFSFVEQKVMIAHYFSELSAEMERIKSTLLQVEKKQNRVEVYRLLMGELSALENIKSKQDMLRHMGVSNETVLMTNLHQRYNAFVREKLDQLRSDDNIDLNEASLFLVDKIREELRQNDLRLELRPVTFKNTGIPTEFSSYFGQILSQVVEQNLGEVRRTLEGNGLTLSGTYWPGKEHLQLILNVNELSDGEVVSMKAGSSITIKYDVLDDLGVDYQLPDQKNLLKKNQLMRPEKSSGGLMASLTTQKGSESVIFQEGEMLDLYVNVSRAAYVRIINIWSDDRKFLLADNYYIEPNRAVQNVKLPFSWETACPCGVEYLQLIASDKPFAPLTTVNVDGFEEIMMPLTSMVQSNRGFKTSSEYYAESLIVLTTIP